MYQYAFTVGQVYLMPDETKLLRRNIVIFLVHETAQSSLVDENHEPAKHIYPQQLRYIIPFFFWQSCTTSCYKKIDNIIGQYHTFPWPG